MRELAEYGGYTARVPAKHESFGATIKRLREGKHWTLAQLEKKSGVEKGTINRIELGKQEAQGSTRKALMDALNRPAESADGQDGSADSGSATRIEDHLAALIAHIRSLSGEERSKFIRAVVGLLDALEHARPAASSGSGKDDERR